MGGRPKMQCQCRSLIPEDLSVSARMAQAAFHFQKEADDTDLLAFLKMVSLPQQPKSSSITAVLGYDRKRSLSPFPSRKIGSRYSLKIR
jgi:hypothetical protein